MAFILIGKRSGIEDEFDQIILFESMLSWKVVTVDVVFELFQRL